ncbi:MAG: DUF2628 domain-containing protein [Paracoccus sp. (in: a-proteobacteria)]|nr:DUF2628 domain-containing protein [Paracoccus sp. (in: a-proteobacteria)]
MTALAYEDLAQINQLRAEAQLDQIKSETLAHSFDDSTGLSWLWAFLFGPIYFAVHGFWGRAGIVLVLNFLIIGFLVAPFLAYPAWKSRAMKRAEQMLLLEKLRR